MGGHFWGKGAEKRDTMDDDDLDTLLFRDSMMIDVVPVQDIEEIDDEPPRLPFRDPDLSGKLKKTELYCRRGVFLFFPFFFFFFLWFFLLTIVFSSSGN